MKNCSKIVIVLFAWFQEVILYNFDCSDDCPVLMYDQHSNEVHHALCSTQTPNLEEDSDISSIPVTEPMLSVDQQWYVYLDSTRQHQIALNISWRPSSDESLTHLRGYKMQVINENRKQTVSLFINITNVFSSNGEVQKSYVYDCFGKTEQFKIYPEDRIKIKISGYSTSASPNNFAIRYIQIPSCEDAIVGITSRCQETFVEIENGCFNRTKTINYQVPPRNGNSVQILLCPSRGYHICTEEILYVSDLPLEGTYNLRLPEEYRSDKTYMIQIWGSANHLGYRESAPINFFNCRRKQSSSAPLSVELSVAIAAFVVFIVLLTYLTFSIVKKLQKRSTENKLSKEDENLS